MIASRLAHFRIVGQLGAGGMGEVYRAEDTRLGREVAIKVLPDAFTADPERLARFEREARMLAALSHPGIAGIHEVGADGGRHFLVMELAAGETLAERIARGPLPVAEAVPLALQIAEALEAAHERGIVHRDLKPANVMVDAEGHVKVLDFGLAKAWALDAAAAAAPGQIANSPTLTQGATVAGMLLGTAAYMSPEQARGRPVDRRADIWAFGCVLYEMLCGRRAFGGELTTEALARVLEREPDWSALPAATPARLVALLRRCLVKDPRQRLRDIGEARLVLAAPETAEDEPAARRPATARWVAAGLVAGLAAGAALGFFAARRAPAGAGGPAATSFTQLTDQPGLERQPTIAPDGKTVVFASNARGNSDLYLLRVGGRNAILLTEDSAADDYAPAFSPDGSRIAFRSERDGGGIFVMEATGESVRRVSDRGFDPHWSPDGASVVVADERVVDPMSRALTSELWVVAVADGSRRKVAQGDAVGGRWSPSGSRIVYWGISNDEAQRDLATVAADGSQTEAPVWLTRDAAVDWSPTWSPDGRWIYFGSSRGGTLNLWRLRIDESSGAALAPPEPVTTPTTWSGHFELTADGTQVVFADQDERSTIWAAAFDPAAGALAQPPQRVLTGRAINSIDVSPDGERIAFSQRGRLWEALGVVRTDGTGWSRLTDDVHFHRLPTWSRDGERLFFYMNRGGRLWSLRRDGSGLAEVALPAGRSGATYPVISPDGSRIAVSDDAGVAVIDPSTAPAGLVRDYGAMGRGPAGGDGLRPFAWSPDGRWLAGASRYGIRNNLVLLDLETGASRVASDDAGSPAWLPDSRRLLYNSRTHLTLIDTRSGERQLLAPVSRHLDEWGRSIALSRDGRTLVFLEQHTEGDVWLMSLAGDSR